MNLWGWGAFVLPYIEQQSLYDALQPGRNRLEQITLAGAATTPEEVLMMKMVAAFRCPSDVGPILNTQRDRFPWNGGTNQGTLATSNYICNTSSHNMSANPNDVREGPMIELICKSFAEIRDGTTYHCSGERRWQTKRYRRPRCSRWSRCVYGVRRRNDDNQRSGRGGCGRAKLNCKGILEPATNENWPRFASSSQHPAARHVRDGGR
jgi:hypothetical protein